MIRKGLLLAVLASGAMMTAGQTQASVKLKTTGNLINQLHNNSTFTANNFGFSICTGVGSNCQTLFTGVQGLHDNNNLNAFNAWANTGNPGGVGGYFDNYKFTFTGVGSYFGQQSTEPPLNIQTNEFIAPAQPVPEAATWAMMIFGFGVVGMAMRRRAAASNFA